jgi:hypothetical protein
MKNTCVLFVLLVGSVLPAFSQTFWNNETLPSMTEDIWCVTYANGTFAASTSGGNVLTSSDGNSWSSQWASPGNALISIVYGGGTWVAVGANGTIVTSNDLKNWTREASGTTNKLNGVSYGSTESGFIAVGDGGTILTSSDAHSWSIQPSGATGFLHGITFVTWGPTSALATKYHFAALVSGQGGILLAAGFGPSQPSFPLVEAPFIPIDSGTPQDIEAVLGNASLAGAGPAVEVGENGAILYNTGPNPAGGDGELQGTWVPASTPSTSARLRGLSYGNGCYVAAGEQGTILTSPDGKTWTQRIPGESYPLLSTATFLGIAYSPSLNRFVIVGSGGAILVSNPPSTVFINVSTRGFISSTQNLIGGFVIEGTAPRSVLLRADGPALGAFGVTNPLPDPVITVFKGTNNQVGSNLGWTADRNGPAIAAAAMAVGAFALQNGSGDSAVLLTLPPGAYTVVVTSAAGHSGTALFEAYSN